MNHEQVSQLCFEESYTVPSEQTARSLFTRLHMKLPQPVFA